jgi:hypothetical protein
MAENALNAAILDVQSQLGKTNGGLAGIYFSGIAEEKILEILKDYICSEINFAGHEQHHKPNCPAIDGFGCNCT